MAKPYESTVVPVAKSQEELRSLLRRFGVDQFQFGEGREFVGVEFVHADHLVRLRCPLRPVDDVIAADSRHVSVAEKVGHAAEREAMRVWRVLVWVTKARLVAVEEGLETFEQAFISAIVNPATGRTVWEDIRHEVDAGLLQIGNVGMKALGS